MGPRLVGRAGFEPATFCTSSRCPNRARLPALAVCLDLRRILGFSELALVGVRSWHNQVSLCVQVSGSLRVSPMKNPIEAG